MMPRVISDKGKGKSAILPLAKTTRVGIVLYSGAKLAAVLGLTDLFYVANSFSAEQGGEHPRELQISHWGANLETGQLECVFESSPDQRGQPDCLIFPPTLEIVPQTEITHTLLDWAGKQHASGTLLCSVCGGAFMLAHMGLLNGQIGDDTLELLGDFGDPVSGDLRRHG